MTNALITQAGAETSTQGSGSAYLTQIGIEPSVHAASKSRVGQAGIDTSLKTVAQARVTQMGIDVSVTFLLAPIVELISLCSREIEVDATAEDALSYAYYRADSEFGTYTLRYSGASATYLDTVPVANTDYWYKVRVTYVQGVGPFSAAISAQGQDVPNQVTTPRAMPGDSMVTLTWTAMAHATSFTLIRRLLNSPLDSGVVIASDITDTTYTDLTAINDLGYLYSVAAINACGIGLSSDEVAVIPHCCLGSGSSRLPLRTRTVRRRVRLRFGRMRRRSRLTKMHKI